MLQHESKDALAREYSMLASQYGVNYPKLSAAGATYADRSSPLRGGFTVGGREGGSRGLSSSLDAGRSEGVRFSSHTASSDTYPQSKLVSTVSHERAVERDLELLDGEIGKLCRALNGITTPERLIYCYEGDLRRRLEVAAVSQTKNIVTEVMEHAAIARDISQRV
jgi:hypothetical protein